MLSGGRAHDLNYRTEYGFSSALVLLPQGPRLQPSTRGRRCNNSGCCDWHGGERGSRRLLVRPPLLLPACLPRLPRTYNYWQRCSAGASSTTSNLVPVLLLEEPAHLVLVHWRRSILPGRGCDCFLNNKYVSRPPYCDCRFLQ